MVACGLPCYFPYLRPCEILVNWNKGNARHGVALSVWAMIVCHKLKHKKIRPKKDRIS